MVTTDILQIRFGAEIQPLSVSPLWAALGKTQITEVGETAAVGRQQY